MPEYYTYKKDADAAARAGQTVKFTAGKGYYVTGTATAPKQVSDAASAGGYSSTPTKTAAATPAAKQPTAALAPPQTSDAASGGGYGTTPQTKQPAPAPKSPGITTTMPVDRPSATSTTSAAPAQRSDAASSGGYGSRYYTYKADAQKAAKPGEKVGFTTGKGYYLYYPTEPKPPRSPTTPTGAPPTKPTGTPPGMPPTPTPSPGAPSPPGKPTEPGTPKRTPQTATATSRHPLLAARQRYALRFFMSKGLTRLQAAAIIGNLTVESGNYLNPAEPGGGIAQWGGVRYTDMLAFQGSKPNFEKQIQFVWHELTTTFKSTVLDPLKRTTDMQTAVLIVMNDYEKPNAAYAHEDRRYADAVRVNAGDLGDPA
jgi:Phage tail lysozyme